MRKRIKIYCLQSHPIQYFAPFFRNIAAQNICDFKVLYCSDSSLKGYLDKGFGKNVKWNIPLLGGYSFAFLKNYSPKPGTNLALYNLINFGIIKVILRDRPEVLLLHGWAYATNWMAIITCKFSGTKVWMKCENPLNQELKKSKIHRAFKNFVLKYFLFKLIDKFLYIGYQNKKFYSHFGIADNQLVFSPYAVDNDRFHESYVLLSSQKTHLREKIGIPIENTVILFSGKLISKKCPMDLLEAFILLNMPNTSLIFLGDGALRQAIEDKVSAHQLKNVYITGFVNQNEISNYYALSDIFVLPSTIGETWGLVANEAMNFGLPVIISDMAGCASDLVEEGVNGYTYPVGNTASLFLKLKELCLSPEKRKSFGLASLEKIKQYHFDKSVKEIENAIQNN
jgi:glycosyltransferase involved in cell wall biosynthesis